MAGVAMGANDMQTIRAFIEAEIDYLRVLSDGMDGMVHANDVRVQGYVEPLCEKYGVALVLGDWPADPATDPALRVGLPGGGGGGLAE